MGRDPKQYIVALTGFYAVFQLLTQVSNPAASPKHFLVATNPSPTPNSPWRPQR